MVSDFERDARRAAVEAVERRWQRQHDAERKQKIQKKIGNLCAILILMAGLAGGGIFFARYLGVEIALPTDFDLRGMVKGLCGGEHSKMAVAECRDEYVDLLKSFKGKKCGLWRDAPRSAKPEFAAKGMHYLFLTGTKSDLRLYKLIADDRGSLSVMMLSPISEPIGMRLGDFRSEVANKPCFILCNDTVYSMGCETESAACALLDAWLQSIPTL